MRKVLAYTCLALACILVVAIFITSTSYLQLILGIVLYPVVAYFGIKVLNKDKVKIDTLLPKERKKQAQSPEKESVDDEKRTFLKLVGTTGLFFFITSLLGNRVGNLLLGQASNQLAPVGSQQDLGAPVASGTGSLSASGYNISEIDEGVSTYYGFTSKTGGWLIMKQDTDTSSFRYAKGDVNFPAGWNNRENLKYDYYYNLF